MVRHTALLVPLSEDIEYQQLIPIELILLLPSGQLGGKLGGKLGEIVQDSDNFTLDFQRWNGDTHI